MLGIKKSFKLLSVLFTVVLTELNKAFTLFMSQIVCLKMLLDRGNFHLGCLETGEKSMPYV